MVDSPIDRAPPASGGPLGMASTVSRDLVVAQLSEAFANDLLTLDEMERRIATAYAATSPTELATLTRDLPLIPVPGMSPGQVTSFSGPPLRLSAVFGNVERGGFVDVPQRLELRVFAGNIELDLSSARFAPGVTEITIRTLMGNVEIVLPAGVLVENFGESFMSSFEIQGADLHAPNTEPSIVRIKGRAILSSVEVSV
ncbi:MAG: DUF1707 domain-containing protein [bacterium]